MKNQTFRRLCDLLTDGKGKWNATKKNPHEFIARGSLPKNRGKEKEGEIEREDEENIEI